MKENWIDFKIVKAAVSMEMILARYQVNWLRKKDDELRGRCPIHQGEGTDTFHASLSKNAFHCFSCKARGNVLDFVAQMEKCSVRDAARKLAEWYTIDQQEIATGEAAKPANPAGESPEMENKPLNFQLKGVDSAHPYLETRGITKATAEMFGVGYFSGRGSMSGRIVIPIHNQTGELVAYAGRAVDDSEPRYKLPVGFHKSLELYNLYRASAQSAGSGQIVVVEGFFDCMKVSQAGFPCVALMGCSMSRQQEDLLAEYFKTACLMLDGDEAGRRGTDELLVRLGKRMYVWAAVLPDGKQPDQLSDEELKSRLGK